MPTAWARDITITNLSNRASSYRIRLAVRRYSSNMNPYSDFLYGEWSSPTEQVSSNQATLPLTLPELVFASQTGDYAQVRVEIALVSPMVDDALSASDWAPTPPYQVQTNYFQLFSIAATLAELDGYHFQMVSDYNAGRIPYDQYRAYEDAYLSRQAILAAVMPPLALPPVVTASLPSGVFRPGESALITWSVRNPNAEDSLVIIQGLQYDLVSPTSQLNWPTGAAGGVLIAPGATISGSGYIQIPDVGSQVFTGTVYFLWKREWASFDERATNTALMIGTLTTAGR